jgi:hypothetical protein
VEELIYECAKYFISRDSLMLLLLYPYIILIGIASLVFQFLVFRSERKVGYMCGSYVLTVFWLLITVVLLSQSYTSYLSMLRWLNRDPSVPDILPTPGNIYENYIWAAVPSAVFLIIMVVSTVHYTLSYRKGRAER